jgi:hypothetical protein
LVFNFELLEPAFLFCLETSVKRLQVANINRLCNLEIKHLIVQRLLPLEESAAEVEAVHDAIEKLLAVVNFVLWLLYSRLTGNFFNQLNQLVDLLRWFNIETLEYKLN